MRIGIFHTTLPSPERKIGGVELVVHRLANQLAGRGHDVEVTTVCSGEPAGAKYAIRRIGYPWMAQSRVLRFSIVPGLLNTVDFSDRDVLNLHGDDWFFLNRSVPTVRTFHGSALREAQSATRVRRKISQYACFPAELLSSRLGEGSYTVCAGMPRGYRLDGTLPQAVGLTPKGARPTAERSDLPSVLFVGTWSGRKRGAWLRDRFVSEVVSKVPDAVLWMVSDECEESDHVRWHRFPSDDELSDLYASAWVFCLPSTYEGFGHPYVEAMAHETPVVASPNPGSRMLLGDGEHGLLATDDALGGQLVELLTEPRRRGELATTGVERAKDFGWDRTCEAYEDAFERAIHRARGD